MSPLKLIYFDGISLYFVYYLLHLKQKSSVNAAIQLSSDSSWFWNKGYGVDFLEYYLGQKLCLEYGLIAEVNFEVISDSLGLEVPYPEYSRRYAWNTPSLFNGGISSYFPLTERLPLDNDLHTQPQFNPKISINFDLVSAKRFVSRYLSLWRTNKLKSKSGPILLSEDQIRRVKFRITQLLDKFPSHNLMLDEIAEEGVDFIATILYLEKENYFKVDGFKVNNSGLFMAVICLKKFFKEEIANDKKAISSSEKRENSKIVSFDGSNGKVCYRGDECGELRPHTREYYMFKLLYEARPSVLCYESLARSVKLKFSKMGESSKNSPAYCQEIRLIINKKMPKIAEMIGSYSDECGKKGYRFVIPSN